MLLKGIKYIIESLEDLELAKDPGTELEDLQKLSRSLNIDVLKAVASNPNIDMDIFKQSLIRFPHEALQNPQLPMWELEDPNFIPNNDLQQSYLNALRRTTKMDETSPEFYRLLARINHVPELINKLNAGHPNPEQHKKILNDLAKHPLDRIRSLVAEQDDIDHSTLHSLLNDPSDRVRYAAIKNSKLDPNILHSLADEDNDDTAHLGVVMNKSTQPDTLHKLSQSKNNSIRQEVARHPNTMGITLNNLVQDDDVSVTRAVARNPNLPKEAMGVLAQSTKRDGTKLGLVQNPSLPADIIKKIISKPYEEKEVIAKAIRHDNTDPETLAQLADHPEFYVKHEVVWHRNTNDDTLRKLAKDPDFDILPGLVAKQRSRNVKKAEDSSQIKT